MSDAGAGITVTVQGEELALLPERAAFWPARSTLLVADPHFGKAATFRAAGIPVPGGTTHEGLARLDALVARTGARRIVFLGDYLHARTGRAPDTLAALARWAASNAGVELVLVRGNHDRHAGDPPLETRVRCLDAPLVDPPFALSHHPVEVAGGYVLAGHLHPGVALVGRGRQHERLPCFWLRAGYAVLPAFGDFTGLAIVEPVPADRVFAVADGHVVAL